MKPLRILVVEDEGIVAFLLAQILESMGHEVCGIENDKAGAIAAARRAVGVRRLPLRPGKVQRNAALER